MAMEMGNAGETLGDGLLVAMVLKGLPVNYKPFAIHVAHTDETITFPEFKTKLRSSEETETINPTESSNTVMKTQGRTGRRQAKMNTRDRNQDDKDMVCFKCGIKKRSGREMERMGPASRRRTVSRREG